MAMKNHVAIIGGVDEDLGFSETVTALDGSNSYRVFDNNGIDSTALLYGVTITKGKVDEGGGMYNNSSSPSLVGVTFSGNTATGSGGTGGDGGGMYNAINSSPTLDGVTFSENTATKGGGGFYNNGGNPLIINGIFWENIADTGSQFYFNNDSTGQKNLRIYNSIVQGGTAPTPPDTPVRAGRIWAPTKPGN